MVVHVPRKIDSKMYQAALAYYGLPREYNRTFKSIQLYDRETKALRLNEKGEPITALVSCNAILESGKGNAVWVQVNLPRKDAAFDDHGRPKKARNSDIEIIQNIPLDAEYPQDPSIAHHIGKDLAFYLEEQGLVAEGQSVEDTGGGWHIGLAIEPIKTTPETAEFWNRAVSATVKKYILPEFEHFCEVYGIQIALSGYDISRVLSLPGTWRPHNLEKPDCDALKDGYLRRWLPPYNEPGNYPVRRENQRLTALIREEFETLQAPVKSVQNIPKPIPIRPSNGRTSPSQWLVGYASERVKHDRSGSFQSLVDGLWKHYGDTALIWSLKEEISRLSGEKWDERLLDTELKRSLDKAVLLPRDEDFVEYKPSKHAATASNGNGNHNGNNGTVQASGNTLPEVIIAGQLRDYTRDALEALEQAEQRERTIFVQSARLVRIGYERKKNIHDGKEQIRPVIAPIGIAELRNALTRSANYYRLKAEGKGDEKQLIPVEIAPPKDLAEAILALSPQEWPFPALEAIVEAPVLRPDGTILDTPGYDAATLLYYMPQKHMQACKVPARPTQKDVDRARALLLENVLVDFPFTTDADKANMFAMLMTPIIRPAMRRHVPMALVDAPKQGTGKGLAVDIVSAIATGDTASNLSAPDSEDEWDKRITSMLMEGNSIICIDNVKNTLESAALDSTLTSDHRKGRILGFSKTIVVPNRATWIATGNNIKLGGDLARRCYRIRLDPHMSRPWMRTGFKHPDLISWVLEKRGELIGAILTIARAWFLAGKPFDPQIPALGTFTDWAQTLGGMLKFIDVPDFLGNLEHLYNEVDEGSGQWEAFLQSWHETFGEGAVKISEVVKALNAESDAGSDEKFAGSALYEALPENLQISFRDKPQSFAIRLGKALEKRVDTSFGLDNLYLKKEFDTNAKQKKWRVLAGSAGSATTQAHGKKLEGPEENENSSTNHIGDGPAHYPHYPQGATPNGQQTGTASGLMPLFEGTDNGNTLPANSNTLPANSTEEMIL